MQPDGPVARGRNLVVLQIEKLVCRHVVGQDVAAVGLEHGGEDEAMEHDVVLADEVHQARLLVLPPFLPCAPAFGLAVAELLGIGNIANRRVEPHVEHLAFSPFHGHRDAPVQIARHGAGLQIHVEPALALAVDVGAPLLVAVENPLSEPLLIVVQGQVPVLGLPHHRLRSADGGVGLDELHGAQVAAAPLALVAVGIGIAAVGAGAHDVTVGQKLVGFLVVELLGVLFYELAVVV